VENLFYIFIIYVEDSNPPKSTVFSWLCIK